TDPFDVIIVAVKTHQLESLVPDLNRLTHDETTIILAQNGYGLRSTLPFKYVYQAVVYISGQKKDDEVIHFRDYRLHIQHDRRTEQLKHYLEHTKIELILEDHIETTIWYKLLVNLGVNSITALGGNTAQILKIPEVYQLCTRLLEEGKQVAMAEGITLP
ncbi:oxidoreductase, partial [Mesorhizobium sp. M7A.F.Ca.CA.002.14.1.2]